MPRRENPEDFVVRVVEMEPPPDFTPIVREEGETLEIKLVAEAIANTTPQLQQTLESEARRLREGWNYRAPDPASTIDELFDAVFRRIAALEDGPRVPTLDFRKLDRLKRDSTAFPRSYSDAVDLETVKEAVLARAGREKLTPHFVRSLLDDEIHRMVWRRMAAELKDLTSRNWRAVLVDIVDQNKDRQDERGLAGASSPSDEETLPERNVTAACFSLPVPQAARVRASTDLVLAVYVLEQGGTEAALRHLLAQGPLCAESPLWWVAAAVRLAQERREQSLGKHLGSLWYTAYALARETDGCSVLPDLIGELSHHAADPDERADLVVWLQKELQHLIHSGEGRFRWETREYPASAADERTDSANALLAPGVLDWLVEQFDPLLQEAAEQVRTAGEQLGRLHALLREAKRERKKPTTPNGKRIVALREWLGTRPEPGFAGLRNTCDESLTG